MQGAAVPAVSETLRGFWDSNHLLKLEDAAYASSVGFVVILVIVDVAPCRLACA